ncbi:bifunctional RNase H/acid phosphatase [Streptomyces sp. TS71-3]|uniref:bifunctional RNase H/acid phosphatase n=1 Tax=Streptomyces sp. TS71-3 TaxID=2733862 RepID=UPI001AFFBFA2|nr:bifunctional RNase H/acid phosphatase [Streptomyces sp. TS71-3]GHJ37972.1 bifunctional RNase H/acid phosphatase [Streptomyces sp. TS71-3]
MREFIVEADGGSRGNPGPAGYGAVVVDAATGDILTETAEYIGVATNNVAEYRGLLAGLQAAHAIDPGARVHVRMDSKLVVEQMSGRWKIKHPDMRPLATRAAAVFPAGQVSYEWMPRERNKHADRLANEAMDAGKQGKAWAPRAASTPSRAAKPREAAPGDASAGAARARAAISSTRTSARRTERPSDGGSASGRAPGTPPAGLRGSVESDPIAEAAVGARTTPGAPAAASDERAARSVAEAGRDTAEPAATPSVGWGPADLGAPATFVLLRHGETHLTPQKRFSGSTGTDPSLSPVGREQAERAAAALAARGTIQAIVSSPMTRCRETAAAVAARLDLPVTVEEGLRETDFADWEGLTFAEVRERHPADLDAWLASPAAAPSGGGESFEAVALRVAAARDKLVAAYAGRTVLLVSHVTPVKTLVRLALGAPSESVFRMELSPASLSAVAYYTDGNASMRLFNDTSHLR